MKILMWGILSVCCIPSVAGGQQEAQLDQAPKFSLPSFDFDSVVVAEMGGTPSEETLRVTLPHYRSDFHFRTIHRIDFVSQLRTLGTTKVIDGRPTIVETSSIAMVPRSDYRLEDDMVANETTTIEYPFDSLLFYDLQGNPVDVATIRNRLMGPTTMVYLGPSQLAEGAVPIGDFFASALRPDLLFFSGNEAPRSAPKEGVDYFLGTGEIEPAKPPVPRGNKLLEWIETRIPSLSRSAK